jgi:hypothetical protein
MNKSFWFLTALLALPTPGYADDLTAEDSNYAIGSDLVYSTDAEGTDVFRVGVNVSPHFQGPNNYVGVRLERLQFASKQTDASSERVYLRYAKPLGDWQLRTQVGTDGTTIIGALSIHNDAPLRLEGFLERDILETGLGIEEDLYTTFGGAALDVPLGDRAQITVLGGLQDFDGENLRTHARSNLIYVISPDLGLSTQLRTRYFRNSVPQEADYFSPETYLEILPVIQMRRFAGGWQFLGALGWGTQKDSRSDWRPSRYLNFRADSPQTRAGWHLNANITYSNHPIADTQNYDYLRVSAGLTHAF